MSDKLRPELMIDNHGGYVVIKDSDGDFAGYDPTPEQITELGERLKLPDIEGLIAHTAEVHGGLVADGADELLRYFPHNFSRLGSTRAERDAIPHNYFAFGEVAVTAARNVTRHVDENEGEYDD